MEADIVTFVADFKEALFVAFISYTLVIKQLTAFVYSRLTARNYIFDKFALIEVCCAIFTTIWLVKSETFRRAQNEGFNLPGPAKNDYMMF